MTVGPVEIFVIAFKDPQFHGEIRAELERLRDGDIIRLVDLLAVRKTEDGVIEAIQQSDLDADEALAFGAAVGALIGLGEHRWAIPVRDAVRRAGGHAVAARWIADSDLIRLGEASILGQASPAP